MKPRRVSLPSLLEASLLQLLKSFGSKSRIMFDLTLSAFECVCEKCNSNKLLVTGVQQIL